MLDTLQKTVNHNLLKYAAGRQITCPRCNAILDYRKTVLIEEQDTGKHIGILCADCFDSPDRNPMPINWQVIREPFKSIKPKSATKWRTSLTVIDSNGSSHTFAANKAFTMFGEDFFIHPRMSQDFLPDSRKGYTVSHYCGAAIAYGDTMTGTIRIAREKLALNGEEKFFQALEKVTSC